MSDTVLITGGLGYAGGRIAQALAACGMHHLRLSTHGGGRTPPASLPDAEVVGLDVTSDDYLDDACRGAAGVVHLAALNEHQCAADPERARVVNTAGTERVLKAAQRNGVKRFVYMSTAHVYGAPLAGTITERSPARPAHPYAATHLAAEEFVLATQRAGTITGIVLRMSNGAGAPTRPDVDRWTLVANDLCRQAVTTGQLTLHTSGLQQRDFITLEDAARAVDHMLHLDAARCGDGLFNLGGQCSLSMFELAERIASRCEAVLGFRPQIRRPMPAPGEAGTALDYRIDKLKETGFVLRGSLDQEIDATLLLCKRAFGTAA